MKVADNLDRHKIFDQLQTGPNCTIYFWVTCPWLLSRRVSDEWSLPIGRLVIDSFVTCCLHHRFRISARADYSLGSYLPLSAKTKTKSTFDFVRSIACLIFIQSLWNLQIYNLYYVYGPLRSAWIFWEIRNKWLVETHILDRFVIIWTPFLIYNSIWIHCLFEIRKIAVCCLWLLLPGHYRVTDEALLAKTM